MKLNETKIDTSKLYFHGSSESRVTQLEAPSYAHPFYVTTDLHYAMAFCTKDSSSTGDWKDKTKKYTPYSQNFVYVVTLNPDCNVFDFRDKKSSEFKKFYDVIDKDIVDWVLDSNETYDRNDIYEFIVQLNVDVFGPLDEDKTYDEYYERHYATSGKLVHPEIRVMSKQLYNKCQKFIEQYGFQNAYKELDIHEIMAPLLKKLNQLGFQGICTSEHDTNEESVPAKVTTEYAIGIFDVNGLDILGLVPMKYEWLKKVNPSYLEDKTSSNAYEKIARFIQLYKKIAEKQNLQESSIDLRQIWYFGNNRSKNLRIAKPAWYKPFFLTTSYEYAQDYADYGVYKIELADQQELNILDFNDANEVRRLNWPEIVVKTIQAGKSDLNSIAYDLYVLAYGEGKKQPTWIEDTEEWRLASYYFKDKSLGVLDYAAPGSVWGSEEDHAFLMQMWKDIHDAGFNGFMHVEFGQKVLALFDLRCIGKISAQPVKKQFLSESISRLQLKNNIPEDDFKSIISNAEITNKHFNIKQFQKLYRQDYDWSALFDNGQCVAAAALLNSFGPEKGMTYVNELQSLISGKSYGGKMLLALQNYYDKLWLMADASVKSDVLLKFYRNPAFNFTEYMLPAEESKYEVDTHVFAPYDIADEQKWRKFLKQYFGNEEAVASLNESYEKRHLNSLFNEVVQQYIDKLGIDLSYMKFKVDSQPVYTNGEPCYEYEEDECAGDWTSLSWIRLNPDMKSVMDRYGIAWHGSDDIEEFTKFIIAHELAHEVWNNIADDQFKNDVIEKANSENFNTVYLETVNPDKFAEETFCEYLAHEIVQQRKKIDFPEEEMQDLSRRKHIVTHRVSDDALLFNVGDIVDSPWQIPYKITKKNVVNDIYDSPYVDQLSQEQLEYLEQFDNIAILDLIAQYDPPYTLQQIKANYPENIYVELANDPVHRWRAETGIELIHKEPTEEELDRIWKNWQLMTQKMKDISDKKSIELFGCINAEHYAQLKSN